MKKSTLAMLGGAALALGLTSRTSRKFATALRNSRTPETDRRTHEASQRYMMYFAMPLWGVAGAVDWLAHRLTKIETTSGPRESVMHLLMMAESGTSVLAGLFLEPNAAMFAIIGAGMLLHQATVIYDVEYTVSRRKIPAFEQHTHTFMETLPFDILTVFACLHPKEFQSVFGIGPLKRDFSLHFRRPAIPIRNIVAVLAGITVISGLPHVEELWRCLRARRQGLTGVDTPECAQKLYAA